MNAFSSAIVQFFTAVTTFFSAFEKLAKTADNIATVGMEASGTYVDEARADRQAKAAARAQAQLEAARTIERASKTATSTSVKA